MNDNKKFILYLLFVGICCQPIGKSPGSLMKSVNNRNSHLTGPLSSEMLQFSPHHTLYCPSWECNANTKLWDHHIPISEVAEWSDSCHPTFPVQTVFVTLGEHVDEYCSQAKKFLTYNKCVSGMRER